MPVRFVVAPHEAKSVRQWQASLTQAQNVLDATWGQSQSKITCGELLQSSLQVPEKWPATQAFAARDSAPSGGGSSAAAAKPGEYLPSVPQGATPRDISQLSPKTNGFIWTVVEAYNQHHHLIIRPDDVWLAILSQFNLYVNANTEDLRQYFVAHEGKKELIVRAVGNRYTVDFGSLAKQMTNEIDKNVLDKELKDWILPDFTTTTKSDVVASAVMMMATLKAYFSYTVRLECGIPSVTLEGKKEDWEKLLARIDRLKLFGKEPEAWAAMLRPILTRFVQAFDGNPDVDFWSHVCHYRRVGSGSNSLGGWITAFSVWDKDGKWRRSNAPVQDIIATEDRSRRNAGPASIRSDEKTETLEIDGIPYPTLDVDDIAPGFCEVDVRLDDNGKEFECMMVSGHMAMRIEGVAKDVVRPHPSWFMFIKHCGTPLGKKSPAIGRKEPAHQEPVGFVGRFFSIKGFATKAWFKSLVTNEPSCPPQ